MSEDELLDLLDDHGRLTGQHIRFSEAHRTNAPHRIATVLVFRPDGKLLMQVHKHHNRRLDHSVGGHVGAGESYLDAARREMAEELELDIPIKLVAEDVLSYEHYPEKGSDLTHVFGIYEAKIPADWQLTETEEVDQLVEMNVEDIVADMNQNPDKYLQGFMTTLGAYLRVKKLPFKILAYGKEWGK